MFPFIDNSFQWRGTNFPDLYEWLTVNSSLKSFKLRILHPGSKTSPIEITIDDNKLKLNIDDWIIKDKKGTYIVIKND